MGNEETLEELFCSMTSFAEGLGAPILIKAEVTSQDCGNKIKGPEG